MRRTSTTVTRALHAKSFESALDRDVPIYVAIDKAVNVEYGTWEFNRDNTSVSYRHVDSVNVFGLIEFIRDKTQTPVYEFEHSAEILTWLREQWAGLFQKMLSQRSEGKRLASLEVQVGELREVSATFKRYLEAMLTTSNAPEAPEIIAEETKRLGEARLRSNLYIKQLQRYGLSFAEAKDLLSRARSFNHLAHLISELREDVGRPVSKEDLLDSWRDTSRAMKVWNQARHELGLMPLQFDAD